MDQRLPNAEQEQDKASAYVTKIVIPLLMEAYLLRAHPLKQWVSLHTVYLLVPIGSGGRGSAGGGMKSATFELATDATDAITQWFAN